MIKFCNNHNWKYWICYLIILAVSLSKDSVVVAAANVPPDRLIGKPATNLAELFVAFKKTAESTRDSKYFLRLQDVVSNNDFLISTPFPESLEFLQLCQQVARDFASTPRNQNQPRSFDDILFLVRLEKIAHVLTQAYDNSLADNKKLGFDKLTYSLGFRDLLFINDDKNFSVLSQIQTCFDYRNFIIFGRPFSASNWNFQPSSAFQIQRFKGPEF